MSHAFLLGIDLEALPITDAADPRSWDDLAVLTRVILACLRRHDWRATFFTVGAVADARPALIGEILAGGHEIACHTHRHVRLDRLARDDFARDLDLNLAALRRAGAERVAGFRAPFFSLTEPTAAWAYDLLRAAGLTYSSSVSASRNHAGGWSERAPSVAARAGIIELPVSSLWTASPGVPLGGLYFRCCPGPLLLRRIESIKTPWLTSFFHPHDFYSERASYVNRASFLRSPLIAALLSVGRRSVEEKLERVRALGFEFLPFGEYLARDEAALAVRGDRARRQTRRVT